MLNNSELCQWVTLGTLRELKKRRLQCVSFNTDIVYFEDLPHEGTEVFKLFCHHRISMHISKNK